MVQKKPAQESAPSGTTIRMMTMRSERKGENPSRIFSIRILRKLWTKKLVQSSTVK
jgi:hypothetical protein